MPGNPFVDPLRRLPLYQSLRVPYGGEDARRRLDDIQEICDRLKLSETQRQGVVAILKQAADATHNPRRTRQFLKERADVLRAATKSLNQLHRWYRRWLREVGLPSHWPPTFDAIEVFLAKLNDDPWLSTSVVLSGHRGRPGKPWIDEAHRALKASGVMRKPDRLDLLAEVGATDPYNSRRRNKL